MNALRGRVDASEGFGQRVEVPEVVSPVSEDLGDPTRLSLRFSALFDSKGG